MVQFSNPIIIHTINNYISHGFSNHPYLNNGKLNGNTFIAKLESNYTPELWHYGVKGMHWGEITKAYEKVGYSNNKKITSHDKLEDNSVIKDTKAKVANLENIKKKMQQNKIKQATQKVIRYGNKVITVKPTHISRQEKNEKIIEKGVAAINKFIAKVDYTVSGKKYSDMLSDLLKNRKVKVG